MSKVSNFVPHWELSFTIMNDSRAGCDPVFLSLSFSRYSKRNRNPVQEEPVALPYMASPYVAKRRGLRDPLDPRNLFRAIYGFRK